MGKTPIKQIYLLLIIIVGIISLSIYSTYALFTYEKETSDIVKITTLETLSVNKKLTEYKRIIAKGNTVSTLDIDVNNSYDNVCYGIWYKVISESNNVTIYKASDDIVTTGSISTMETKRISLVVVNNDKNDAVINIGISTSSNDECSLDLDTDKHLITDTYVIKYLNDYILSLDNKEISKEAEYKMIDNYIVKNNYDSLIVSSEFDFLEDGIFVLKDSYEISIKDLIRNFNSNDHYYYCNNNCHEMYEIKDINSNEITTVRYIPFIKSINGIIKYDNNYQYYGANPDNYICFNNYDSDCELYRIIGLFYNKDKNEYNIKLVKNDYIGSYSYSNKDNYLISENVNSNIYNVLKEYYDNNLIDDSKKIIIDYEYKTDYNDTLDSNLFDIYNYNSLNNYRLKVGMLSLVDYLYSSNCNNLKFSEYDNSCLINNWLYKYDNELLINRFDSNNEEVYMIGDNYLTSYDTELNVRPVVYLNSDIEYVSGDGTIDNPFMIR